MPETEEPLLTAQELADSDTVVAGTDPDALVGQVLGDYRIVRRLGAGGMGVVYHAEHVLLGRSAALKVLRGHFSVDDSIVERFFNEAKAASSIRHPGIVEVYDFGQHDGRAFLVMAFLEGESLETRLVREGALSIPQAVRIARQVASALAAAHAQGIVHRDLKPDNVFLVPDPDLPGGERIQLLDFGIAKLTPAPGDSEVSKTQTGAIMGSPLYMSPEQCQGAGGVDPRTDLYSLGCVLYRMLAGRLPFNANFAADIIASHLRDTPPPLVEFRPEVSPELVEVVSALLAKDPGDRFTDASALHRTLSDLPDTPTLTGSEEVPRPGLPARGPWRPVWVLVSLVVLGGLWLALRAGTQENATLVPKEEPLPVEVATPVQPAPPPVPDKPPSAIALRPGLFYEFVHRGPAAGVTSDQHIVIHHERYWSGADYFDTSRSGTGTPLVTIPKQPSARNEILRASRPGDRVRAWEMKDVPAGEQAHIDTVFEVTVLSVMDRKRTRPISDDEIATVLAHFQAGTTACYERERRKAPTLAGGLAMLVTIHPNGRPQAAVESNGLAGDEGKETARCITRLLRTIRFPQTGHRREYRYQVGFPIDR